MTTSQIVMNGSYFMVVTEIRVVFLKIYLYEHTEQLQKSCIQLLLGYTLQSIYSRPNSNMVGQLSTWTLVSDPGSSSCSDTY